MNKEVQFLEFKSQHEITREWDSIALARDEQLRNDADISFTNVLKPYIAQAVKDANSIIDIGCGTGGLSATLQAPGRRLLSIDPSSKSIQAARNHDPSGDYLVETLESWVTANPHERFDLAVVNMVLMDVPDLGGFCRALSSVIRGGRAIATITHPSFWPVYWNYASKDGFDYMADTVVEAPFRTTSRSYGLRATHFHRPLSTYFAEFSSARMTLTEFEELRGMEPVKQFPFPRFIAFGVSA